MIKKYCFVILCFLLWNGCSKEKQSLDPVSVEDYEKFVDATGYITDAERYGWSIVQTDIHDFITSPDATWRVPDGINVPASKKLPVTQVSYNDAMAYCKWAQKRLPSYDEYWALVEDDTRMVVSENILPISNIDEVNVLGNVWEITTLDPNGSVRLAGGSLFCSIESCNGTVKERALYVDVETGNLHIGFATLDR